MPKNPPKIRCQAPTREGHPCQNVVDGRGLLCHQHREEIKRDLLALFWSSLGAAAKIAGAIQLIRRGIIGFSADQPHPFDLGWVRYKQERERLCEGGEPWYRPGTLESAEGKLLERLSAQTDEHLLDVLRTAREAAASPNQPVPRLGGH